jgi:hypothetical protein
MMTRTRTRTVSFVTRAPFSVCVRALPFFRFRLTKDTVCVVRESETASEASCMHACIQVAVQQQPHPARVAAPQHQVCGLPTYSSINTPYEAK